MHDSGGSMSIRNALISMAWALFAAGVATSASAQTRREGPCAADAQKFCGDVQRGGGRIAQCMKAHEAQLSPACQEGMKQRAEKAERVREECKADVAKFCQGVKPGGGRIVSCLKGRQADLQPACAAEFNRGRK